jgi:integrase
MNFPITSSTTVADLVDHWLYQLRTEGRLQRTTIDEYERVLRALVAPRLGSVRLGELTTSRIDEILSDLGIKSLNRQRKAKVITGAMLDTAVAIGALEHNPVRGSLSISRPPSAARSLTSDEVEQVRDAVRRWQAKDRPGPKSSGDMADIIEFMLATGARIGEALALRWRDIDLRARTVEINATIKTERGFGTHRKALAHSRLVALPESALLVLGRRRSRMPGGVSDAVFPTRNGTWQQVNNVERRWRQIRREAGLDWIAPDMFRPGEPPRPGNGHAVLRP